MKFSTPLLLSFFAGAVVGCSRPTDIQPPAQNLSIISISPMHGPKGTIDTIRGAGFGASANVNSVFFNGKSTTVLSAAENFLIVSVPKLCGTGPVSVTVNGTSVTGPTFTYDTTVVVSTLAGTGSFGNQDGPAAAASFRGPTGIAVDSQYNVYVTDSFNLKVRRISASGQVSTLSGVNGAGGYVVNTVNPTLFQSAIGLCIDAAQNIYLADGVFIRKLSPTGKVSTYAGSNWGFADGTAATAMFKSPNGLFMDGTGNLYVTDRGNFRIRKITPTGIVSTVAGTGIGGWTDGPVSTATLYEITGITATGDGTMYVADIHGHMVRKISNGQVITFAGQTAPGTIDGVGTAAKFNAPNGCVVDKLGNVYVTENGSHRIRKIAPDGSVKRFAGGGPGTTDGPGNASAFAFPAHLAIDKDGNMYVADFGNNKIRKVTVE